MKLDLYQPSNPAAAGRTVVKLVANYRSHPKILEFPNKEFYGGELQPVATAATIDALRRWKVWPTKGFPILFHSIRGGEAREGTSPSFFNGMEITQVLAYYKKLLQFPEISPKDIGARETFHSNLPELSLRSIQESLVLTTPR